MIRRKLSAQTIDLLRALLEVPDEWRYGYDLSKQLNIKSGTLYPILIRLSERGYLEHRWSEPQITGRPPRHMYRLTAIGRARGSEMLAAANERRSTELEFAPESGR